MYHFHHCVYYQNKVSFLPFATIILVASSLFSLNATVASFTLSCCSFCISGAEHTEICVTVMSLFLSTETGCSWLQFGPILAWLSLGNPVKVLSVISPRRLCSLNRPDRDIDIFRLPVSNESPYLSVLLLEVLVLLEFSLNRLKNRLDDIFITTPKLELWQYKDCELSEHDADHWFSNTLFILLRETVLKMNDTFRLILWCWKSLCNWCTVEHRILSELQWCKEPDHNSIWQYQSHCSDNKTVLPWLSKDNSISYQMFEEYPDLLTI